MVKAGGVGVLISNITMWMIYIRKIEGREEGVRFRTHVDACGCGNGGFSLLYATVARIILKGHCTKDEVFQ